MNLVEATIDGDDVAFGQFRVPLDPSRRRPRRDGRRARHPARDLRGRGVRAGGLPTIDVDVEVLEELGSERHVFFSVDARAISAESLEAERRRDVLAESGVAVHRARRSARRPLRVGDTLRLAVDPARFHFFDRETGASLMARARRSRRRPATASR